MMSLARVLLVLLLVTAAGSAVRAEDAKGAAEAQTGAASATPADAAGAAGADRTEAGGASETEADELESVLKRYPSDPRELWARLVANQNEIHSLVKVPRMTVEIMDEIAALCAEEGVLLIKLSEAVTPEMWRESGFDREPRVLGIALRRSATVGMHAVHSLGAAAETHVPGTLLVPLHTFDIQLKVVEEKLPKVVIEGQLAREPEDVDVRKIR